MPRIALVLQAKLIVDTLESLSKAVKIKAAAGCLSETKLTNCSSLVVDNLLSLTPHGALTQDLGQDQSLQLQVVSVMLVHPKRLIAVNLVQPRILVRPMAAAGAQHLPIHLNLDLLIPHGATTKREPTHVQPQHGMLKTQDSQMISSQR